ncbi:MAG TPA: alpha/beta fold hydrolase [Caulobacteraceae bacterium]|jgi:alpha-beta hydrolase superfamily lysophospholipase|nr:alpha/beta fold hydrolase [Caulobacteraceae bacterium]
MIRRLAAGAALSVLLLNPVVLASVARAADAPAPAAASGAPEDATVAVDSGNEDQAFLYGSFLRPTNKNNYPAVLILPEAGADRNGNATDQEVKPDTYRELAQALADKGIASVRIDKRGVGQSAKAIAREEDLRFETYVDDAVTWIKFLQAQPHVGCVAVYGHSESAMVAALAARKVKVCAIIEAAGSSRPFAAVLAAQLKTAFQANRFTKEDYDEAVKILDQLAAGKPVASPPAKLNALFRPSVQPYLMSWLNLNPVEALKTNTPVLILQGSSDFELTSDDPRRLSASPKNVRVVMVPGADHDLKIKAQARGKATADQPRLLAPQVASSIQTFLDSLRWP